MTSVEQISGLINSLIEEGETAARILVARSGLAIELVHLPLPSESSDSAE